jgi:PEP-CTERM motif
MRIICVGGFIGLILILSATAAKADGTRLDGSHYMSDADNENFKVPASEVAFDDGSSGSRFSEFLNASHGDGGGRGMDGDMDRKRTHSGAHDGSPLFEEGGSMLHVYVWRVVADANAITTPEPATLLLLGTGLIGFGILRRRRKTSN